jgi:3D-(3,5/4)-trihydroxycyclohexane-1,2-dione acylhydrolase (decyclizing)
MMVVATVNEVAHRIGGIAVGAARGLPGEMHKLWNSNGLDDYHLEYGYSCMGYEVAGGVGVGIPRLGNR